MKSAYTQVGTQKTPQSEPILGREEEMVKNSGGGFVFKLDKWKRLDRFLILGSDAATYYVGAKELTLDNARNVLDCIKEDPERVTSRILEVSEQGLAPNNEPALFALAMMAGEGYLDPVVLSRVARIGTHLFHFIEYVQQFRGWGRALREAVAYWYNSKSHEDLVYQVVKYRQRDGWTHRDVLRLAHPEPVSAVHDAIFAWVCREADGGEERWATKYNALPSEQQEGLDRIIAFELAQHMDTAEEVSEIVTASRLTREMVPTEFLKSKPVWEALLPSMPAWALLRNLGNLGRAGLLVDGNWDIINKVVETFSDQDYLRRSRLHPMTILIAMKTYAQGRGFRGSSSWPVVSKVVDVLDKAFYLAFGNVEPTNMRIMLALDVSSSMGYPLSGSVLTCAEGAGAMALVTANVEPNHIFTAFSSAGEESMQIGEKGSWGWGRGMSRINISPRERLDDVVGKIHAMTFGSTDCALPMLYAAEKGIDIDAFVVYTDNETWAGDIHPVQALQMYRDKFNKVAKLIVVGMTSTGFTIADPTDPGMLDIVGFDASAPAVISEFIKGSL